MSTTHQPTPTPDAATLPPFINDLPKRTRRGFKRPPVNGEPTVRTVAPGVVSVSLFGGRAAGRHMLIDAADWADVASRLTTRFVVNTNGNGCEYVRSGADAVALVARQPGSAPTATLARILAGATRRQVVSYRNGNRLDLRRDNLILAGKAKRGAAHGV